MKTIKPTGAERRNEFMREKLLFGGGREQIEGLGFQVPHGAWDAYHLWGSVLEVTAPYRRTTGDRLFEHLSESLKADYRESVLAHFNLHRAK